MNLKKFLSFLKDETGAKVTGPLFSMGARGTIGDAVTYSIWKGIEYARQWFIPSNPQSVTQVNVRTALTLLVALWQALPQEAKDVWDVFAQGTRKSGFNQFVGRGMNEYVVQLTTAVTPLSVTAADYPPDETWTWTPVA